MIDTTFLTPLRAARVLLTLTTALALAACVLPTKIGDLPDGDDSTGAPDSTSVGDSTTGQPDATDATTKSEDTTATTTDATTQGDVTFDSQTSEQPGECEALGEADCALQGGCVAKYGAPFDFPGCSPEPTFLGCLPSQPCDLALTTVCRDGTDEAYQASDGCIPAGFTACDSDLPLCGGDCDGLDEAACAANNACTPIHGHPHVTENAMACVDNMHNVFLACHADSGACPPFVPTVCAKEDLGTPFDVPSGCIPSGFVECEGAGTPACP